MDFPRPEALDGVLDPDFLVHEFREVRLGFVQKAFLGPSQQGSCFGAPVPGKSVSVESFFYLAVPPVGSEAGGKEHERHDQHGQDDRQDNRPARPQQQPDLLPPDQTHRFPVHAWPLTYFTNMSSR